MEDLIITHKISSYECSADHLLKPECFMLLCQEMAESHAELHGFGYDWGMQRGMIWVEVQGDYEFMRRPAWKETVTLRTNTGKASALLARRFVEMSDAAGHIIARADLLWVLIDFKSRRPIPLKRAQLSADVAAECLPIATAIVAPDWPEATAATPLRAPYRDIDFNGHINNSAYLIWVLDSLPAEERPGAAPRRFHLAFKRETFLGDALSITRCRDGQLTRHLISGEDALRAEVIIEWA